MSKHAALYATAAWQRRREAQLRAEPLCAFCLARGRTVAASIADHVKRHDGDSAKFFNSPLQSLCKPCHDGAKQELENTGHLRGHDASGWPVDPGHPWNGGAQGGTERVDEADAPDRLRSPMQAASYFSPEKGRP